MSGLLSKKNLFLVSIIAGVIELIGGALQTSYMLNTIGVTDVFSPFSIPDSHRINLALYLTFLVASTSIIIWAGSYILKGHIKIGRILAYIAVIPGILTIFLPTILGYSLSYISLAALLVGSALIATLGYMSIKLPVDIIDVDRKIINSQEIAIVAIFSALTAVFTATTGLALPSPTGGYTHFGDTAIYIAALLFGVKVGGLVGIIGPVIADLFVGYPRWFVTVVAHGGQGFVAGLGKGKGTITQVVLLAFSGIVMSTTYFLVNVFIKGYPIALISFVRDLFGQSLISIILGLVLVKSVEKTLPSLLKR